MSLPNHKIGVNVILTDSTHGWSKRRRRGPYEQPDQLCGNQSFGFAHPERFVLSPPVMVGFPVYGVFAEVRKRTMAQCRSSGTLNTILLSARTKLSGLATALPG